MSLILHLSDLHLGTPSGWQLDYTDKFGLDKAAGDTKIDHLRRTLGALGDTLTSLGRALDAVVVSGDLTNANAEDGYAAFPALLAELGAALPGDERIVVVPGNHDADWKKQPGNPAKFKQFLDVVRKPYHSPLISGLDYDRKGRSRQTGSRPKARPILDLGDAVVLALNSADFCGVEEEKTKTPWDDVVAAYRASDTGAAAEAARKLAADELRGLRVQDMARVDKHQLEVLEDRLKASSLASGDDADEDERTRIAVLHHPIGPVSDREEIKGFETLTNLEQVRAFLFDHGFHIVLHGHKHASYLGWDWLLPSGDNLAAIPRRALVVGSPGDFRPAKTVCRLIDTSPDGDRPVAGAPRVRIIDVPGVRIGQSLAPDFRKPSISLAQPFVRSIDVGTPWVVRARTADAAYQQLRDLPIADTAPRPVVSVVENAASAWRLPVNYPEEQDAKWLESLVTWWQHPRPEAVRAFAGSKFNHGERLYAPEDAIRRAALALPSTKAIALLFSADEAGASDREFPSLTAIQLQTTRPASGTGTSLDAVGIYRKQDLSRWWPVNMAELAFIQEEAVKIAVDNAKLDQPVVAGRLVAMATLGLHDTVLPKMAGTALDRAIDLRPDWPHRLAYVAAQPGAETQAEWTEATADIGLEDGDDVLVPSIGLIRLKEALAMHRELGDAPPKFRDLVRAVDVLARNAQVAADTLGPSCPASTRKYWAEQLRGDAVKILRAVRSILKAAGITWN